MELDAPVAELWALCYLHDWDSPKEGQQHRWEPGRNVFPEVHAFYRTWQEAEAVRRDMTRPDRYWVVRARPESEARLQKTRQAADALEAERSARVRLEEALTRPITMQDIRLAVGEGKLFPLDILAGANAELQRRLSLSHSSSRGESRE